MSLPGSFAGELMFQESPELLLVGGWRLDNLRPGTPGLVDESLTQATHCQNNLVRASPGWWCLLATTILPLVVWEEAQILNYDGWSMLSV